MNLLREYIESLRDKRSYGAGTKETSYYPCLVNLLDGVGAAFKPKVGCLSILQNTGAGHPDFGLFDKSQMQKGSQEPRPGQMPSCGVIEVKSTQDDAWLTADTDQVSKYWNHYGQVLVTNYRDFLLVGRTADGRPAKLESYRLAPDEQAFWQSPIKGLVDAHGERFIEFLTRLMLHPVPLQEPEDVAWFLASYARDARSRVKAAQNPRVPPLRKLDHLRSRLYAMLWRRAWGSPSPAKRGTTFSTPLSCRPYSTGFSRPGSSGTRRTRLGRAASHGRPPGGPSMCP